MVKVLLVDDEPDITDPTRYNLRREGLDVRIAADGNEALREARAWRPDVIVLDIMLPGIDGLEVCRQIRNESVVPIIMLSAKGDDIDKVVGLEVGADDYMTKPFSQRELLARIKAQLRRTRMPEEALNTETDQLVRSRDLQVNPLERRVILGEKQVKLKPKEFDLLLFLMQHPRQVFTRSLLLEKVWGYTFGGDTRTVDVHINSIRGVIEEDPKKPLRIQTVRGVGYRFES